MKTSKTIKLLKSLTFAVLVTGAVAAASDYVSFQGYTVSAGCSRSGTSIYVDGHPTCDCTSSLNGGTCSCVIKCPSGGGDGDIEMIVN